jgi:polyhydroxyalkanoate synthesis regulator phasin
MDPVLLQVSYLSVFIVVLLGLLVFLWMFWSKAKKSGFQSRKLDETSSILTYEQMVKQGKLTKEEYNKIQRAMLQKEGFTATAPKDVKTEEPKNKNIEEIINNIKNQKSN